jgi:hypothetical protein
MRQCKYHPTTWVFKKEGETLRRGVDVLRISPRPRIIQPDHRATHQLHRNEGKGWKWVSSLFGKGRRLFFEHGGQWFTLTLKRCFAELRISAARIPFVYHRDFVALNATRQKQIIDFQTFPRSAFLS